MLCNEIYYTFAILTAVLSNLFDPAGRIRHNHEAAGRTCKLKSNRLKFVEH